jgi:hypothetical protein
VTDTLDTLIKQALLRKLAGIKGGLIGAGVGLLEGGLLGGLTGATIGGIHAAGNDQDIGKGIYTGAKRGVAIGAPLGGLGGAFVGHNWQKHIDNFGSPEAREEILNAFNKAKTQQTSNAEHSEKMRSRLKRMSERKGGPLIDPINVDDILSGMEEGL